MNRYKNSILIKFSLIFVTFILIPVVIACMILLSMFSSILIENNTKKNLQLTEQIANNININLRLFRNTVASIANDDDILPSVNQIYQTTDKQKLMDINKQIENKLKYYFNYTNDLSSVIFVFKEGGYYYYGNPPRISDTDIKKLPWYKNVTKQQNKVQVLGTTDNFLLSQFETDSIISLAISPDDIGDNSIELVYFAFKPTVFQKLYSQLGLSRVGKIDVLSTEGKTVIPGNQRLADYLTQRKILSNNFGWSKCNFDNNELLITYFTIESTGWKVVNSIPYTDLTYEVNIVFLYTSAIFIGIGIVFFIVFFTSVLGTVIMPVKNLIRQMKRVETGDFDINTKVKGEDEISKLSISFVNMVGEIKNLIIKLDAEKTEKMQLEILALQYQINPHFLFNTLNAIKMMASMQGVDNIKKMTEALTRLLLDTLGKGGNLTTVENEIENLESYAYIMKIRYGDRFDIIYNISDRTSKLCILRLLLQPIVENSIIHGQNDVFSKIEIKIDIECNDNKLFITISDNGAGLSEIQVEELFKLPVLSSKGFSKMGIGNVNKRIKMNYGDEYGLSIDGSIGKGTVVKIVLPVISKEEINSEEGVSIV